ncbi:MAG: EAL domain-containing protein [Colwellia sp.]|nr:EAL domain-containing protein [Colwellia sp.]
MGKPKCNSLQNINCQVPSFIKGNDFFQIFNHLVSISIQGYDENRRVIYWNKASEELYGYSAIEAMGQKMEDLIIPDPIRENVIIAHQQWVRQGISIPSAEITLRCADNSLVDVFSNHIMYSNEVNEKQMYCIDINLSSFKRVEAQAQQKELLLQTVFKAVPDLFFLMDHNTVILDYYADIKNILHIKPEMFMGKSMLDVLPENAADLFKQNIDSLSKNHGLKTFEYQLEVPIGFRVFEARLSQLPNNQIAAIIRDVTDKKVAEERILHQAHYDSLTDLPNRFLALDRLAELLVKAQRNNDKVAVLFLDLDDFKKINDTLGHEIGDKLLMESAERLRTALRNEDTVGRLGGDEFIILLKGILDASDTLPITENLLKKFREPFKIDGRELILTVSVGISVYPEDGRTPSQLLRNADAAMYQAKALGRNTYSFFTEAMNIDISRNLNLEEQIRGALERREFEVYYQPQIDVDSGRIIGAEALLRWHNQTLGNVSPVEFIPVAEKTGLIVPIGEFVLKQALSLLSQWQKSYDCRLRMAVNLSPRQFRDPELINFVKNALNEANISASSLELEITEGVLMIGHSYIDEALSALAELGVLLSMDDFGTGYSSLSYLRQYSFDVLKVDRSFISGIADDSADRNLVNAAISMAHSLGMKVVAEGVETEEQMYILEELNCDYVQGFLFSKPLPVKELYKFSANFKNTS